MATKTSSGVFSFSLRELLGLFAAVAGAFAALKFASSTWLAAVAAFTMLVCMYQAVVAFVDRGPRQAFALGFILCAASYLTIFFVQIEVHPFQARFPTSRLLRIAFEAMRERLYVDEQTGVEVVQSKIPSGANVIEDYSWTITPPPSQGGELAVTSSAGYAFFPPMGAGSSFRRIGDVPPRQMFMPIGHFLWALLIGYLGGRLGKYVYARRVRTQAAVASS